MIATITPEDVVRARIQMEMKLHGVRLMDICKDLKLTKGHVQEVFYYGRRYGADQCWAILIERLGFDPRTEVSPVLKQFAEDIANPPGRDGLAGSAQG